jgi:transposase
MNEDRIWVGLDLGLARTSVCVVDDDGVPLHELECETKLGALKDALAPFPMERIGLIAVEAGSDTHIVRKLRGAGFPVVMFDARKASKFLAVRRNKTDASDARGLADLARVGRNTVSQVYLKSRECEQLRGLLVMRNRLVMMRVAMENFLRSRLALYGRPFKAVSTAGGLRLQVQEQLADVRVEEGVDLRADLQPLVELCESLKVHLAALDRDLKKMARSDPVCRLLMGVPGVGPICALSFTSAVEDPGRFRAAADVGAYLGLVPRRYQSGSVSRTLGITKSGSRLTRTHLVTSATVFGTTAPDCALKRWYLALRGRAGSKRARVALARKLAVILLTLWKTGKGFELDPAEPEAPGLAVEISDQEPPTGADAGNPSKPSEAR